MSIEGTPESHLRTLSASEQPHARHGAWLRIIGLIVVVCLGVVVWRIYQNQKQSAANSANQAAALQSRPVPVQVTPAIQRPMPIFLTALGTVTPYMSVTVKARVNGQLEPVKFTEGQQVRQGETIMVIDPRPYKAALDQAKGTLAHDQALLRDAQAEYARYKALYDAGVTSKETLDTDAATQGQYQGALEADNAAIEAAQLQLDYCTIQSPINGRIGLRLVDPGNMITANTTNLVVINQFEPIAVYFTLPENELPEVLKKLAADKRLPVDAYDRDDVQKLASGYLLTADNQIDTTTGTDKLKAVFDNKDQALFPNQFVNIHLVLEPAQCNGGAIGGHPIRLAGILCLGHRYRCQGSCDQPDSARKGGSRRGTAHDPGRRPATWAERRGRRSGPLAPRTDCDPERGSSEVGQGHGNHRCRGCLWR